MATEPILYYSYSLDGKDNNLPRSYNLTVHLQNIIVSV